MTRSFAVDEGCVVGGSRGSVALIGLLGGVGAGEVGGGWLGVEDCGLY